MLEEIAATTERAVKTREEAFGKIHAALAVHEAIEEEIFYPALKEHPKSRDVALEGYEEHHVVDTIMGELLGLPVDDERWTAKFAVMKENLEHHIEEEEGEMFAAARRVLDEAELKELGARMELHKEELQTGSSAA
jgi:hypothetical protein